MARPLSYTPPPAIPDRGQQQVTDFVAALDASGLRRAATGAVRTYPELAELLVQRLDPDTLRALVAAGGLLQGLDPDATERGVRATRSAVSSAGRVASSEHTPSLLALVRLARDPDVRRGVASVLVGLRAFGRALRPG